MEKPTPEQIEHAQEIDDLQALNRNLNLQLTWAKETNRDLRKRLTRANNVLGIEDWERAA